MRKKDLEISKKILFLVAAFGIGIGIRDLFQNPPTRSQEVSEPCSCVCHHKHEKEMGEELARLKEIREEERKERAQESARMMKEQEEFCSRPFREFLEELEKNSHSLSS